ncbi:hypothetical protein [Actinoplanes sp. RD1]|uniref:hypothetical protein n=1 Tax=Actinoplanes sp. RD1 TaxID=3064538 RepID=UPI0027406BB1|nr:hypothetical protein [Actinoplanes sp. RD1]
MRRRHVAAAAIAAGSVLALAACSSTPADTTAASSAGSTAPTAETGTGSAEPQSTQSEDAGEGETTAGEGETTAGEKPEKTGNPILDGERQVVIAPADTYETVLHVDDKGHLALTDGESDTTLFVLVPVNDEKHWIRTAKADSSGEQACIGLSLQSTGPAMLDAAPCDASKSGQLFTIESKGDKKYAIKGDKGYNVRALDDEGVQAVAGASGSGTTFGFADNGKAPAAPGA